ncbi:uncharacterized protein LOC123708399 [Pieris brassicae]|uniref:uncharacterized protein LOC123708399 n=1 Tax=Pieris brassicae TaxID=7116 RepID=UPI001E661072|nr:uncharacterized protein LOC123708399 [Pieris brassicae]XP_045515031.1 uncharacterized protein LOC123708399 [Pieris brassicae]XP_045515032.1 uncharacterized protein LOC123708399 [Pieris brassicae]
MVWNMNMNSIINETPIRPSSRFLPGAKAPTYSDVMEEFRNNGVDLPYEPETDTLLNKGLSGFGPARKYLTQRSCPEAKDIYPTASNYGNISPLSFDSGIGQPNSPIRQSEVSFPNQTSSGINMATRVKEPPYGQDSLLSGETAVGILQNYLNEEQIQLLNTIPSKALYFFINYYRKIAPKNKIVKDKTCRFCKNNGECESVYRSHRLRTEGKLSCPVLRHLVCERCGATGDDAHTIKYCKAITPEERRHYELLMYNRRLTSVTRPYARPISGELDSAFMKEVSTSFPLEGSYLNELPPQWMELERKLSMQ